MSPRPSEPRHDPQVVRAMVTRAAAVGIDPARVLLALGIDDAAAWREVERAADAVRSEDATPR